MKKILIQFAAFFLVIASIIILFNGRSNGWIEPAEDEVTSDILLSGQMYSGKLVVNVTLHPDGTGEHDGNGEKTPVTWEKGEGDVAMIVHMNIKDTAYDMQVVDDGASYSAEYPPHAALTLTGKKPVQDIILSGEKYSGKVVVKVTLHPDGTMEHEGNGTVTEGTWEAGSGDVAMIAHFPVKGVDYDMDIIDNGTNYVADYPLVADMQLTGAKNGDGPAPEIKEDPAATEAPAQQPGEAQPAAAAEKAEPEYAANTFVLKYTADINEQLTGAFSAPFDVWSAALGTTGNYTPAESEDVLLSWNSQGKSTEMDFYANGVYEFRFTKMNIAERGTWSMKDGKLSVTTEKGREIAAELIRAQATPAAEEKTEPEYPAQTLLLHYVADINAQLTGSFSAQPDVWKKALGESGSYAPTESEAVLFTWASKGKSTEMDFFANGTYEFRFTKMNIAERGVWAWQDGTLTVTTAGGNTITAEMVQ